MNVLRSPYYQHTHHMIPQNIYIAMTSKEFFSRGRWHEVIYDGNIVYSRPTITIAKYKFYVYNKLNSIIPIIYLGNVELIDNINII